MNITNVDQDALMALNVSDSDKEYLLGIFNNDIIPSDDDLLCLIHHEDPERNGFNNSESPYRPYGVVDKAASYPQMFEEGSFKLPEGLEQNRMIRIQNKSGTLAQIRVELHKLICTDDDHYKEAKTKLSGSLNSVVPIIATAISASLGIAASAIIGIVAALVLLVVRIGQKIWCNSFEDTK